MKSAKDTTIRIGQTMLNTIQHALSTASHHYVACQMLDGAMVRPSDRLSQIQAYEKVFGRLLEIEVRNGWRKPLKPPKEGRTK